MLSIALITIYFILLFLHTGGTSYIASVSFSPMSKIENFAYLAQFRVSLVFGIAFIWTDILIIYILLSGNKFVDDVEYMEAFIAFLYMVPFAHCSLLRTMSIFRGVAVQFYKGFLILIFARLFLASIIFVGGITLCALSEDHYVPVFTASYFAVFGLLNTVILTIIKRKMKQAKLVVDDEAINENVVVLANDDGRLASSSKFSVNSLGRGNLITTNAVALKAQRTKQDEALKEIAMTVKAAGMNSLITAIATGVVFIFFNDASFLSGAVVNVPFKFMAAFAMIVLAKIEATKRSKKVILEL